MNVEIYSRQALEERAQKPFAPGCSLISIGDTDALPPVLQYRPEQVLYLRFDDITLQDYFEGDGWKRKYQLFSQKQAQSIAEFVYRHRESTKTWICQCEFGQSRSAAVAAAILEHFDRKGISIFADEQERYSPNAYVFNMALRALEETKKKQDTVPASKSVAWMIRRDGEGFLCMQHLYGGSGVEEGALEETLYAAQWLYEHTGQEETQALVLKLVAAYGSSLDKNRDTVRNLYHAVGEKPYVFLPLPFLVKVARLLPDKVPESLEILTEMVNRQLNEEFLRTRLGGLYYTTPGCRDLYFRISSHGFDWSGIISQWADKLSTLADTVTVVEDEESTGQSRFYRNGKGEPLDRYPWDPGESLQLQSPETP